HTLLLFHQMSHTTDIYTACLHGALPIYCIVDGLARLDAGIPVLSEESAGITTAQRREWSRFWLVDPLDGTREFVKRNGEFTVNIALIEDGVATFGVVQAPVSGALWHGGAAL